MPYPCCCKKTVKTCLEAQAFWEAGQLVAEIPTSATWADSCANGNEIPFIVPFDVRIGGSTYFKGTYPALDGDCAYLGVRSWAIRIDCFNQTQLFKVIGASFGAPGSWSWASWGQSSGVTQPVTDLTDGFEVLVPLIVGTLVTNTPYLKLTFYAP